MTAVQAEIEPLARSDEQALDALDLRLRAGWQRAVRRDRFWRIGMPILTAALIGVVWQRSATQGGFVIPTIPMFLASVVQQLAGSRFWSALVTSETALAVGFGAAVVLGIPLGLAAGRARAIEDVIDPYVSIAIITPMAIIMPIMLMIFGLTFTARVVVVFIFAFPFVLVPVRAAVLTIAPELWEMCRSYGASELQLWWELLLPGTLPAMVSGLRQGLAHGFSGMILVELLLLAVGVGRLLLQYQGSFDYSAIFAVVFLLVCESWLLMGGLAFLERRARGGGGQGDALVSMLSREFF
ncbi:MAG TPA: ABC transporter permease subunit [Chloroflexota bacterium]|nr:ABC transporter permease subunit [Chloroflexota bacterium]